MWPIFRSRRGSPRSKPELVLHCRETPVGDENWFSVFGMGSFLLVDRSQIRFFCSEHSHRPWFHFNIQPEVTLNLDQVIEFQIETSTSTGLVYGTTRYYQFRYYRIRTLETTYLFAARNTSLKLESLLTELRALGVPNVFNAGNKYFSREGGVLLNPTNRVPLKGEGENREKSLTELKALYELLQIGAIEADEYAILKRRVLKPFE